MFEAIVEQLRPHFKEERRRLMLAKERARAIKAKEKEFKRKEEEKENECDDESNNKSICDNKTLEDGRIGSKNALGVGLRSRGEDRDAATRTKRNGNARYTWQISCNC